MILINALRRLCFVIRALENDRELATLRVAVDWGQNLVQIQDTVLQSTNYPLMIPVPMCSYPPKCCNVLTQSLSSLTPLFRWKFPLMLSRFHWIVLWYCMIISPPLFDVIKHYLTPYLKCVPILSCVITIYQYCVYCPIVHVHTSMMPL